MADINHNSGGDGYLLGIDTGGTFTDSVLLDYAGHNIISCAKTLTDHGDLARGIIRAIEKLEIEDPEKIMLVGMSSTLATNSVAEGKIRKTGLILIGYDPDLIADYHFDSGFSAADIAYFNGGHNSQGAEQASLDIDGIVSWVNANKDNLEALAVSAYFSPLNAAHEYAALEAISQLCDLPIVLGHQLSTRLDSIKRASTACLNASLVAVMHEFTLAVQRALKDRRITAPLMVVKGNGYLMPQYEAVRRPVETVLSGPAASTIGGKFFSRLDSALVIDIGGTTTDMALMRDGAVTVSEDGARVGNIVTAVRAARIRTAVVGCDSRLFIDHEGQIGIGPDRVVPLSRLAAACPAIRDDLEKLYKRRDYNWKTTDLTYWMLQRQPDPETMTAFSSTVRRLLSLLAESPQSLSAILKTSGVLHEVQLNAENLIRNGIIGVAALTPTDLLHVIQEMDNWCARTSELAVAGICQLCRKAPADFISLVLNRITAMIAEEAIVFLARENHPLPERIDGRWGRWLFDQSLGETKAAVSISISSRFPIIGIGAPAGYFVKRVAEILNARFVLPAYASVANAAGAVVGLVMTEAEALVYVHESGETRQYIMQAGQTRRHFKEEETAMDQARETVSREAREQCRSAGAKDAQVNLSETKEGPLHRILARAIGSPGI